MDRLMNLKFLAGWFSSSDGSPAVFLWWQILLFFVLIALIVAFFVIRKRGQ